MSDRYINEKYRNRLIVAVYSRIPSNLEEYTIDSTIGRDIGILYKNIVTDVLKTRVWVSTYEVSDGKYQIEFYFNDSLILSLCSKATDTADTVENNIMESIIRPYIERIGEETTMVAINTQDLLNRFISKGIKEILDKYKGIEETELENIVAFINEANIPINEFDPYEEYEQTRQLAEVYKEKRNSDAIRLMLYLNRNKSNSININEALEKLGELSCSGISEDDRYYLYYDNHETDMVRAAEEYFEERLEDSYEVARIFDSEEIADMWIAKKSVIEVVEEMLEENQWWEVLDCDEPEQVIEDNRGMRIMISMKNNS